MKGRLHTVVAGALLGFIVLMWAGPLAASLGCKQCDDERPVAADTTGCQWMTPTSCCDQPLVLDTPRDVVGSAIGSVPVSISAKVPSRLPSAPPPQGRDPDPALLRSVVLRI